MKKTSISLLMAMLLGAPCFGEQLVIEIMEFDCTEYPELYEKYINAMMPKTDSKAGELNVADTLTAEEAVLNEIELVAEKTLFLNHSQEITIGEEIDLVTKLQDFEFKLKASTEARDDDLINVSLDCSLSAGKNKRGSRTEISVRRGETIPIGGGAKTQTTKDGSGETKEIKTVSVMRFTIK